MSRAQSKQLPIHFGHRACGEAVTLPIEALRRHVLALGGTGSGKTVFCKAIAEEAIRYCLPVVAIDLQGDLLSLAKLAEDPQDVPDGALPVSEITVGKLRDRLDVKIWSPGSSLATPISFAPNMSVPDGLSDEDRTRSLGAIAADLAKMLGDTSEATIAGLFIVLEFAAEHGVCRDLDDLAQWLASPPPLLVKRLEPILGRRTRKRLVKALAVKRCGANRLLYDLGESIDVWELFGCRIPGPASEGKARLSIIYLAHLSPAEQQTFLSLLFSAMYRWMLGQDDHLKGLLYVDEIAPLCPPVKNPPAKEGLMMLLRQARKYGLCCMLATQSPGDLDYKAIGQIGTVALGRLGNDAGLSRVKSALPSSPAIDAASLIATLPAQSAGEFIVVNKEHLSVPTPMRARWLATEHRVVRPDEIGELLTTSVSEVT